jgi:hypothetical protein
MQRGGDGREARPDLQFTKVSKADAVALDVDSMLKSQVDTFKSMADVGDMHKSHGAGLALMARKDTHEVIKEGFMAQATTGIMSRFLDGKVIKRLHKKSLLDEKIEEPTEEESLGIPLKRKRDSDSSSDSDSSGSDSSNSELDHDRQKKKKGKKEKQSKSEKKKVRFNLRYFVFLLSFGKCRRRRRSKKRSVIRRSARRKRNGQKKRRKKRSGRSKLLVSSALEKMKTQHHVPLSRAPLGSYRTYRLRRDQKRTPAAL